MCAERLPWQCHRYLVSDYLVAHGARVAHIIDEKKAGEHRLHAVARVSGEDVIYDRMTDGELNLND